MPIAVNEITDKQLLEVLSYTEGHCKRNRFFSSSNKTPDRC